MLFHVLRLVGFSLISGILVWPVSFLDTYFITTFSSYPIWLTFGVVILSEILTAMAVYYFGAGLAKLVIRKQKTKDKLDKWSVKFESWGFWGMVIGAATPLPYSLMLYFQGISRINSPNKVIIAVIIGRSIKYLIIIGLITFGINIFGV